MQQYYIITSSILVFVTYAVYAWSIVTKRTMPHRTTRLILFVVTAIGAISSFAAKNDIASVWLLGSCSIFSAIIFLLSIKHGVGGWSFTDLACLIIASIGIITWRITSNPMHALYASIIADFSGMVPTILKTYHNPKSEYWFSYVSLITAIILSLVSLRDKGVGSMAYPIYLLCVNCVVLILVFRRPKSSASS